MPYSSRIQRSVRDPLEFQRVWLKRRLWAKQLEIARSVEQHQVTAVKGCHASGKTYLASGLPLWWLTRHLRAKVLTTAPTLRQVKLMWEEISLARRESLLDGLLPPTTTTGLKISEDRYGIGASSSRGVNMQGFHGENVLIIADEAPGIEPDIWDAIEGIRAGGSVRVLQLGNPVVPSGYFYDTFTRGRAAANCISISAFDTPNLQDEETGQALTIERLLTMPDDDIEHCPFPSLVTRRWVKERYQVWGPDHPKYQSRVLGEFPTQSPKAVFPLAWIERAKRDATELELQRALGQQMQVGIDVAGPGHDETTLCARVNGIIIAQHAWADADPRGPVARLLSELRAHRQYRLGSVVVDSVGIGYNFALHLADLGFPVLGFIAGARAVQNQLYANLKAEAYFTLREWLRGDLVSQLNDEECEAQLSTVLYEENERGLTQIESKRDAKKDRSTPSPDRAEAVVMAFARVLPAQQEYVMPDEARVSISPY